MPSPGRTESSPSETEVQTDGNGIGTRGWVGWDSEQGQANGSPSSPAQKSEESKVASPGRARCSRWDLERNPRTDPGLNEKTIQTILATLLFRSRDSLPRYSGLVPGSSGCVRERAVGFWNKEKSSRYPIRNREMESTWIRSLPSFESPNSSNTCYWVSKRLCAHRLSGTPRISSNTDALKSPHRPQRKAGITPGIVRHCRDLLPESKTRARSF